MNQRHLQLQAIEGATYEIGPLKAGKDVHLLVIVGHRSSRFDFFLDDSILGMQIVALDVAVDPLELLDRFFMSSAFAVPSRTFGHHKPDDESASVYQPRSLNLCTKRFTDPVNTHSLYTALQYVRDKQTDMQRAKRTVHAYLLQLFADSASRTFNVTLARNLPIPHCSISPAHEAVQYC